MFDEVAHIPFRKLTVPGLGLLTWDHELPFHVPPLQLARHSSSGARILVRTSSGKGRCATSDADSGPDTVMWTPSEDAADLAEQPSSPPREAREPLPVRETSAPREAPVAVPTAVADDDSLDPDQQAMDDFFEDSNDEFEDEPRFGGRLRRRR